MTKEDIIRMAREAGFAEKDALFRAAFVANQNNLERFASLVAAAERNKVTKERDRMCEHCKWRNYENSTLDETNQPKILGKG